MDYRIEDKYIVTEDYIAYLKFRLETVMNYDSHMKDGSYLIRSIYFDDMYNSCLEEVEGGYNHREKFRIRTYDNDPSMINLELKSKVNGRTNKKSVKLTTEEEKQIVNLSFMPEADSHFLIKKLWAENRTRLLKPVNIVEYERTAFVEPKGNVRITFDRNIGTSSEITRLFDDDIEITPIMPAGHHILEIKYDEFLPSYIRNIIDVGSLQKIAYSKYYCSRRGI